MTAQSGKKELRAYFKALRASHETERALWDKMITERVLECGEYKAAKRLLAFVSNDIEVSTREIIDRALKEKEVYCPRCIRGTSEMRFFRIMSTDDLEKGYFGILEPKAHCGELESSEGAVCLTPGLAYDERGFRLGFGKGFYDRFFKTFSGVRLGICYDECVVAELPADEHDIGADLLITESRTLRF
ncbi:MAG: 5-formyltetrahydrofolate cyclo-ligase [Ruminococcus sp.]|nr:5-formyltetrahydrofolate cyclo-ligase [Ruminococcus sp.]